MGKDRQTGNLRSLVTGYPIPVFALVALLVGSIANWSLNQPNLARWIWLATVVIGGVPIVWNTLRGMLRRKFAADIVAMLAIVSAIILGEGFAGSVIVLMQSGGEAVENYGRRRATSSLEALVSRAPRIALRKRREILEEIDATDVQMGDLLVVRPGDIVPVDGTVSNGQAELDESALSGEPLPRFKKIGDQLLSGAVSVGEVFEMRADSLSGESQYAKIVQLVRKAQYDKPPIQRLADRYAVWFTPITIAIAIAGWIFTRNPTTMLSVLVVATPCSLILATPVAVLSAIDRASAAGIVVKSGAALEQIGKAQVVVFDKTGTITFGTPVVERIITFNGANTDELLYKTASVEQLSLHPVGHALAHRGLQAFGKLPLPTRFQETPGRGVEGYLNGENISISSQRLLGKNLATAVISSPKGLQEQTEAEGKLVSFITINGKPAGAVIFTDQIRPGVPSMIQRLRDLGVRQTLILTGDNEQNARIVARQAGITHFEANLLATQKAEVMLKLREQYHVAIMVGDGINDAPALATATVGIAMGAHGTGISAEAADMVLQKDDITEVADAVMIGQRMLKIAKQSIYIGLSVSFILMIIAIFGYIPPAIGALQQELLDIGVILNALRAR